jgi:hypothetical protein
LKVDRLCSVANGTADFDPSWTNATGQPLFDGRAG